LGKNTSTPQYAFMAWCSVKKHRDNFTYTYRNRADMQISEGIVTGVSLNVSLSVVKI